MGLAKMVVVVVVKGSTNYREGLAEVVLEGFHELQGRAGGGGRLP